MNQPAFLLDTNIVIPLEDYKPLAKPLSEFIRLCSEYGVNILVHEASLEDIENDKDETRKAVTLSKLEKFPIAKGVVTPEEKDLEKAYGQINSTHDHIDCKLLHAVDQVGVADFLLTQDQGIHRRAKNAQIANKLFTVDDALEWIRRTYEPRQVVLPKVIEKFCHEIDKNDSLFDTLREDYDGFDEWFKGCCKSRRKCWVIEENELLAGILIWKNEALDEIGELNQLNPNKVFKICTFKVSPRFRGERFGEQLLKQALWFAYKNQYDLCYLTVFSERQGFLTTLIETYGFVSFIKKNGEDFYVKKFKPDEEDKETYSPLEYLLNYYPSFKGNDAVSKFIIPIRPEFHEIIFPERREVIQESLFSSFSSTSHNKSFIPGNSIQKVYLSRAPCKNISSGDIVIFYMSKNKNYLHSQSITTLCVVESVCWVDNLQELIAITAKRSVYTLSQLEEHIDHCKTKNKKLTVINLLVCGHMVPPITLSHLLKNKIINGPPQQPQSISIESYKKLSEIMELDF